MQAESPFVHPTAMSHAIAKQQTPAQGTVPPRLSAHAQHDMKDKPQTIQATSECAYACLACITLCLPETASMNAAWKSIHVNKKLTDAQKQGDAVRHVVCASIDAVIYA